MSSGGNSSEYSSEIRNLVNQNVISEMTAQIHLGQFRNELVAREIFTAPPADLQSKSPTIKVFHIIVVFLALAGLVTASVLI